MGPVSMLNGDVTDFKNIVLLIHVVIAEEHEQQHSNEVQANRRASLIIIM